MIHVVSARAITLPADDYDVVGSIVLYKTPTPELKKAIQLFLGVPLKTHLCIIDNSPYESEIPDCDASRVSYCFLNRNIGYGSAHNLAIRAANGKSRYHLVMNTDISYDVDVVIELKKLLDSDTGIGMASPRILYPDGTLQYVCRKLPTPLNLFARRFLPNSKFAKRLDEEYELRWWDHSTPANLPYLQGSFMFLRTKMCNDVGGFDERFFMYGEDIDLTRRMYAMSKTVYFPSVSVVHEYRRYSKTSWRGTWIGIVNNARYFNKWGWVWDNSRRQINDSVDAKLRNRII